MIRIKFAKYCVSFFSEITFTRENVYLNTINDIIKYLESRNEVDILTDLKLIEMTSETEFSFVEFKNDYKDFLKIMYYLRTPEEKMKANKPKIDMLVYKFKEALEKKYMERIQKGHD